MDGIGTEVEYEGYERQKVDFNFSNNGSSNKNEIQFPTVQGGVQVESIGVFRGENMLMFQNLAVPLFLNRGDNLRFEENAIVISFD